MKQRVSDAKAQGIAASCAVNDATVDGDVVLDLALDLADCRALLAAVAPVVKAAVAQAAVERHDAGCELCDAVDALTDAVRKEFTTNQEVKP